MHKLRVVQIACPTAIADYPECVEDTQEFPHLVEYVEDDMEIFVVDTMNPQQFWPARDFFMMVTIKSCMVDSKEWNDGS